MRDRLTEAAVAELKRWAGGQVRVMGDQPVTVARGQIVLDLIAEREEREKTMARLATWIRDDLRDLHNLKHEGNHGTCDEDLCVGARALLAEASTLLEKT